MRTITCSFCGKTLATISEPKGSRIEWKGGFVTSAAENELVCNGDGTNHVVQIQFRVIG